MPSKKYEFETEKILLSEKHMQVLKDIQSQLQKTDIIWAITGTAAFALRGLQFDPQDIDLQTDKKGAYGIAEEFEEYVVDDVAFSTGDNIRSHFGVLEIRGIQVEVMGNLQKKVEGSWETPVDLEAVREFIEVDEVKFPVLNLEYEQEAYEKLGRDKTAKKLQNWMNKK